MDIGFDAPHYWYTVPEDEKARSQLTSDWCSIDGQDFFIRGVLKVPILGTDEALGWGMWTSVSHANFERYIETFDSPSQSELGTFTGWLSNQIPDYPDMLHLVVRAELQDNHQRPLLGLEPVDHPLANEQRHGITTERLAEILTPYLHPPE